MDAIIYRWDAGHLDSHIVFPPQSRAQLQL